MIPLVLRTLFALSLLALAHCSGSAEFTGAEAEHKFSVRTGAAIPPSTTTSQMKWVLVGDTFTEYYRFDCPNTSAEALAKELESTLKKRSSNTGDSHANQTPGTASISYSANAPNWWKGSSSQLLYHTRDFTTITFSSSLTLWYDADAGAAFVEVNMWE